MTAIMRLDDGTELPELALVATHTHTWMLNGIEQKCWVQEMHSRSGTVFLLSSGLYGSRYTAATFLTTIVAHYLSKSWTLKQMDATSAVMEKVTWG